MKRELWCLRVRIWVLQIRVLIGNVDCWLCEQWLRVQVFRACLARYRRIMVAVKVERKLRLAAAMLETEAELEGNQGRAPGAEDD